MNVSRKKGYRPLDLDPLSRKKSRRKRDLDGQICISKSRKLQALIRNARSMDINKRNLTYYFTYYAYMELI